MGEAQVSVLVPSFNTAELTKLCLRSLRKHTDSSRIKVLVVDNGSKDASVDYLRSVPWIEFYENTPDPNVNGAVQHAQSLDLLLAKVTTPYVLSIHTDTIVLDDQWLDFLLGEIEKAPDIAGVGSWKLEKLSPFKKFIKGIENFIRFRILFPLRGKTRDEKSKKHYLRSHCALYRTDLVRKYTGGFYDGDTAGRAMHNKLENAGFRMVFVNEEEMMKYLIHFDHATAILNKDIFHGRRTGKRKFFRKLDREIHNPEFSAILADDSFDK